MSWRIPETINDGWHMLLTQVYEPSRSWDHMTWRSVVQHTTAGPRALTTFWGAPCHQHTYFQTWQLKNCCSFISGGWLAEQFQLHQTFSRGIRRACWLERTAEGPPRTFLDIVDWGYSLELEMIYNGVEDQYFIVVFWTLKNHYILLFKVLHYSLGPKSLELV